MPSEGLGSDPTHPANPVFMRPRRHCGARKRHGRTRSHRTAALSRVHDHRLRPSSGSRRGAPGPTIRRRQPRAGTQHHPARSAQAATTNIQGAGSSLLGYRRSPVRESTSSWGRQAPALRCPKRTVQEAANPAPMRVCSNGRGHGRARKPLCGGRKPGIHAPSRQGRDTDGGHGRHGKQRFARAPQQPRRPRDVRRPQTDSTPPSSARQLQRCGPGAGLRACSDYPWPPFGSLTSPSGSSVRGSEARRGAAPRPEGGMMAVAEKPRQGQEVGPERPVQDGAPEAPAGADHDPGSRLEWRVRSARA